MLSKINSSSKYILSIFILSISTPCVWSTNSADEGSRREYSSHSLYPLTQEQSRERSQGQVLPISSLDKNSVISEHQFEHADMLLRRMQTAQIEKESKAGDISLQEPNSLSQVQQSHSLKFPESIKKTEEDSTETFKFLQDHLRDSRIKHSERVKKKEGGPSKPLRIGKIPGAKQDPDSGEWYFEGKIKIQED